MEEESPFSGKDLVIRVTRKGKSVFAGRSFRKGEFVIEFRGKRYTKEEYLRKVNPKNNHFLQIDTHLFLGPTRTPDNYINHSCDPNTGLTIVDGRVLLHAIREIPPGEELSFDYSTTMGNAAIKAEKTVQYEIGLWQELAEGMGLEVALFYRDIYDLLSTKIFSTYNQIEYGLYSNKDYGNVKGLEVKYDYRLSNFSTMINYTLQYTRANADNPTQTFDRAGNSRDPINRLIPLSWDQRHTLNVTVGYNTSDYGLTLTGYYNSGAPYTWSPIGESMLSRVNLYPNNNWRPSRYTVDLNGYYDFSIIKNIKLRVTLNIYNLLDRLNEEWVNAQTGRAYTAIIRQKDIENHRSDFNTYQDRVQNPSMYSAPRLVKLGFGVVF